MSGFIRSEFLLQRIDAEATFFLITHSGTYTHGERHGAVMVYAEI